MIHPSNIRSRHVRRGGIVAGLLLLALAACDKGPDRNAVAAQIKGDVETQLQNIEGSASPKVLSHAAVTVTPAEGDQYQVVIDGLKFQPDADGYLDIGTVSYLALPKDEQSYEVSGLKVAPEIPFKGADGKDKGKLKLTTRSFSGLWSRELATFRKLDAEFADIAATDDRGGDVSVAAMKIAGELADKGGNTFDSVANVLLTGFKAKESTGDGVLAVGEIAFDGRYDALKMADYQAGMKKYQELIAKHQAAVDAAAKSGAAVPAMTAEEQQAVTEAVGAMAAAIKGGAFKVAMKQLAYTEGAATPFSLDQLNVGSSFDGVNAEKASLGFDIAHQGLTVDAPEASGAVAKAVLPKQGNLGLKVTELPSKDLIKVLADNMPGVLSADANMAEANAMAMLVALQAVLQTSGAKIEVTPSAITADLTEVKADGAFDVSPQAVWGAAGALNVAWTGLDEVMALAQANPADPSAQDVISVIAMLLQFAERGTAADGKAVDKFKIEVKENGEMSVNGKPM